MRLSGIWAIEDLAFNEIMGAAQTALFHSAMPSSGPTDQAERDGLPIHRNGKMAIVTLRGPMTKRIGWLGYFLGFTGTELVRRAVDSAASDDEIEQILLVIDSPGGSVDGLADLGDAVKSAAQQKRVVVQVDGTTASAAYYVASQANVIYAGATDQIGSIGVRLALYDWSKHYADKGVEAVPIDTGAFKSLGLMGTEITDEHRTYLQGLVDAHFDDFVNRVATGRGIDRKAVLGSADGRMFFASDALSRNLIDGIQPLDQTIKNMEEQTRSRTQRGRNLRARVALSARRCAS